MNIERQVEEAYTHGSLEEAILDGLRKSGKDIAKLNTADLAAIDHFHLGWHQATAEFAKHLDLHSGMKILDVGCGIGGPARYFAEAFDCEVCGIDLSQEFVDVATSLSRRVGLSDMVTFRQASGTELPVSNRTFDRATMMHVGMNISDKPKVFGEVRRALKPGGVFGVYEVMRVGEGELPYPMPWALTPETSFVERPADYRHHLEGAGFEIESETDRGDFARALAREMREKIEREGPSPLGAHTLMGESATVRLGNVFNMLNAGVISPVEIVARAV